MLNKPTESEYIFDKKHQIFLNFIDHTNQAKNAVQYMEKIIPGITHKISDQSAFRYLDVGCGYGYKTQSIINAIKRHHVVNTTAIDPSSELLGIFKNQTKDDHINFVCQSWEDYQPIENFHFISSIHTFYYIDDWESAINKMMRHLTSQGVVCIAIRANDEICHFKDYFFEKIHGSFKKERNFHELCNLIKQMDVKYNVDIVESKLNIKDCLLDNTEGKQLIEFLLRQPYADLSDSIKKDIIKYLEANHHDGYLTHQDGFVWISA
jgi:SAM-dependent methyltransferase